ncbi:splicing factor 45-like [Dysidea avara]|uniref:splicing factor 45-like n=1 Tax=Dysidea avara TaxID=196820 RepID=UPI003327D3BB
MSLYDGIEVETAPISPINIPQAMEVDRESEKPPATSAPIVTTGNSNVTTSNTSSSGLASSLKFMAPQLQRRKAPTKASQRIKAQPSTAVLGGKSSTVIQTNITHSQPSELVEDEFAMGVVDEYDPFNPNDYDLIVKDRRKRDDDEGDDDDFRRRGDDRRRERKRRHSSDSEDEEERRKESRRKEMAAIPPPAALSSSEEPPPPAATAANNSSNSSAPATTTSTDNSSSSEDVMPTISSALLKKAPKKITPFSGSGKFGSKVASQIMNKYGWKEGQGLGKSEQGISTALSVEKTSKRGGKIINLAAEQAQAIEQEEAQEEQRVQSITEIMKNPSKVILLKNMVGPGEVDDDLQPEVTEECSKYGEVVKCLVYEIPSLPDHEAVRIFVEFNRVESAIKAVVDLNGRFFGGRTVSGNFFDHKRFANYDLAP